MHHSPSSLSTAVACERKWYYEHVERRRDPEIPWDVIEAAGKDWAKVATPKQRSAARGTATHAVLEAYYEGRPVDWSTYIGQIAMAMRPFLPSLSECAEPPRVEKSIGDTPYPRPPAEGDPGEPDRTCLMIDGVRLLGYVDLEAKITKSGAARLGLHPAVWEASGGWWTFDYKTSKDVERYALTPEEAATDEQGVIYSEAGMVSPWGRPTRGVRWVYAQTEGRRFAKPVDQSFTRVGNRVHLARLVERAQKLEAITSVDQAVQNPDACQEYGGCPHHVSRGGPCNAARKLGRMNIMGFREAYEKKQAEKKAGGAPPNPTGPTGPTVESPPPAPPPTDKPKGFKKRDAAPEGPPADAPRNPPADSVTPDVSKSVETPPAEPKASRASKEKAPAVSVTNVTNVATCRIEIALDARTLAAIEALAAKL